MSQIELFEVPSPCVGICQSDSQGMCKGCWRTRDERFNWLHFTAAQKRQVIQKCSNRKRRVMLATYRHRQKQSAGNTATLTQDGFDFTN